MDKIDRTKILVRHTISSGVASSQRELGEMLGYSNASSFSQVITGYKALPKGLLDRWKKLIPDLNTHWVETGEGTMLLSEQGKAVTYGNTVTVGEAHHSNVAGGNVGLSGGVVEDSVPIIPSYVTKLPNVDIHEWVQRNENILSRSPRVAQFGDYSYCIYVTSDEMAPSILPGDRVALKEMVKGSERKIASGRIYIVDTKTNGCLMRRVYRQDDGLVCKAENAMYVDEFVPWDEVIRVYVLTGGMRMWL